MQISQQIKYQHAIKDLLSVRINAGIMVHGLLTKELMLFLKIWQWLTMF